MTIARQTKGKRGRRGGKGKGGNKAGSEAERGQNYRGQGLSYARNPSIISCPAKIREYIVSVSKKYHF